MTRVRSLAGDTFKSLRVRNYRFYFFGQIVSVSGTWMQTVAQAWLVLRLTHSAVALGTVTALQFLPLLLFGAWGGLLVDRFDKQRLLMATQFTAGLLALVLGVLTATGEVELWMVYLLAGLLGCVTVVDNPGRQAFVPQMVGREHVRNAVSLNSVVMNSARLIGPGVAGALIATVGIAPCFFVNAASYGVVFVAISLIRRRDLHEPVVVARARGQVAEGLRYVWSQPGLRDPLIMMVIVGTLAYEFQVTLPVLARQTFHGGPGTFGAMLSAMSAGAVIGGLFVAARGGWGTRALSRVGLAFGLLLIGVALGPTLATVFVFLPLMGAASIAFISMSNATLQLRSTPEMRGRVMALFAVAFLGSTPVGAPIAGAVAQAFGPRAAIAMGAVASIVVCGFFALSPARRARRAAAAVGEEIAGSGHEPTAAEAAEAERAAATEAMRESVPASAAPSFVLVPEADKDGGAGNREHDGSARRAARTEQAGIRR